MNRAQECVYVLGMHVCLHVHASNWEEWKEFSALFCIGVQVKRVARSYGVTVKAVKK